ncbi:phosphate transporter PHO1 homolog 10-like isoform X2 [Euphorbia lathyris]|uniref:phosphate transporter PHO1 homolog 10-like isoform X2 n=1 Tax=Euphorbia lathyris TaxID=212925 RepID=UPI003313C256
MRFGKEFKKQMVPEWTEAYMDYNALQSILRKILKSRQLKTLTELELQQPTKGDIEDQVIHVSTSNQEAAGCIYKTEFLKKEEEGGDLEASFFQKLDEELNKVNAFYKDKVEEMIGEASLLNKQMNALIALRIKLQKKPNSDCVDETAISGTHNVDSSGDDDSDLELSSVPLEINDEAHTLNHIATQENDDDDEKDPMKILDRVKIKNTLESPVSTIKGVFKDSKEEELSFNKVEMKKVEERLRAAFIEFYQKLRLLKHYSYMNLEAFSRIMKKYEEITSRRRVSKSYMKIVDDSYLGSSDEVSDLLKRVEFTFLKHFSNSDRRKCIKELRPKQKRETHNITFFSGFFCGCSIALLVAVILKVKAQKLMDKKEGISYVVNIIPLYSLFAYIVLHMLTYATNVYFWKRYKVNYPFIFGFKQGTELEHREVFLLSNGLAVLSLASFLVNLHLDSGPNAPKYKTLTQLLLPLGLVAVILAILFCPFDIIYRSSRFFFNRCLFRCICAPLYKVRLPDFFLADHLTSQFQAIRSLELYICYYGLGEYSRRQSKCHNHGVYNVLYFILPVIPFWLRFLQCFRRLCEDKDKVNAFNGLKYISTIIAMVMRTMYELRNGRTTWLVLALICSAIAAMANTYWDIVVDWGLMRRKSKNPFLRDKLVLPHKSVYFGAMALNVILRVAWMQMVLEFSLQKHHKMAASTLIACLEIIRRGIWSFFRLENEHLNNVGKFRAFKSVPLPFNYYDSDDDDKDD